MQMELRLRYYGDPVLTRKTVPIGEVDAEVRELAEEMRKVMLASRGVGLAANQVGVSRRLLVMDPTLGQDKTRTIALVNPRVTRSSGAFTDEEGCLSFPGLRLEIRRPLDIRVEATDLDGNAIALEASGFLARIFMHELDHLDGKVFFWRLPLARLIPFLFRLPGLRRKYRAINAPPQPGGE